MTHETCRPCWVQANRENLKTREPLPAIYRRLLAACKHT